LLSERRGHDAAFLGTEERVVDELAAAQVRRRAGSQGDQVAAILAID
jgi:hypothetical protein